MSIRFAIRNTQDKATVAYDGTIDRYSGVSERFKRSSERASRTIKVNEKNEPIAWRFNTGLDPEQVKFYAWYSDEEKKAVADAITELKKDIDAWYGGSEVTDPTNVAFWRNDRDVNRLSLTNEDIDTFFDTKYPIHALLYLSIISGAFIDTVAPTKDWAETHEVMHYLALETDAIEENDPSVIKGEAYAALVDLKRNEDPESLFILAWCLQYDTTAFAAITKSTPQRDLIAFHNQFIEGKLRQKRVERRNTAQVFLNYYDKWKGQQTRPNLYVEAYIKAADYFSLIKSGSDKKFEFEGTPLGNSVEEAVKTLNKKSNADVLTRLRDAVEDKWK